jgi:hypothetical protein
MYLIVFFQLVWPKFLLNHRLQAMTNSGICIAFMVADKEQQFYSRGCIAMRFVFLFQQLDKVISAFVKATAK